MVTIYFMQNIDSAQLKTCFKLFFSSSLSPLNIRQPINKWWDKPLNLGANLTLNAFRAIFDEGHKLAPKLWHC